MRNKGFGTPRKMMEFNDLSKQAELFPTTSCSIPQIQRSHLHVFRVSSGSSENHSKTADLKKTRVYGRSIHVKYVYHGVYTLYVMRYIILIHVNTLYNKYNNISTYCNILQYITVYNILQYITANSQQSSCHTHTQIKKCSFFEPDTHKASVA